MQTQALPSTQEDTKLFAEKDRIDRLSRIRELVFGSLDGLLVPLGVVSGVAGGGYLLGTLIPQMFGIKT